MYGIRDCTAHPISTQSITVLVLMVLLTWHSALMEVYWRSERVVAGKSGLFRAFRVLAENDDQPCDSGRLEPGW